MQDKYTAPSSYCPALIALPPVRWDFPFERIIHLVFTKVGVERHVSFAIASNADLLVEAGPLRPNEPILGWDGSFRGTAMAPAVFVFYAEVEFVDGLIELVKGDVVLLR